MIDVNGKKGIVIFDGVVIEIFGFGKSGSERIHILQVQKIKKKDLGQKINLIIVHEYGMRQLSFNKDEFQNFSELIEAVRAASNLQDK